MTSFRAKSSISSVHLFPGIFLLQPPEQGKGQSRKSKCQLMPDIRTLLSDESSNWSSVPSNLHSQGSTEEPEAESANGTPSKRQKILIAPRIKIIVTPSCSPEDEMFFRHHNNVNDSPVSDDTQEGLESSLREESRSATTDDDCGDEPKCDENNARDAKSPRTEVLCMHGERIVVWDVVLLLSIQSKIWKSNEHTVIELRPAITTRNFPKPPAGLRAIIRGPPTPKCL